MARVDRKLMKIIGEIEGSKDEGFTLENEFVGGSELEGRLPGDKPFTKSVHPSPPPGTLSIQKRAA
jgi:hypothetical protein